MASAEMKVGPQAMVTLREITLETLPVICDLSETLSTLQRQMVADNAYSIAEAYFCPKAWFRAVYAGEVPVGFLMLRDDPQHSDYYMWRLMIAAPYQRMGLGRRAVQLLIEHVKTRPGAAEMTTSCEEGDGSPLEFYRKLGFVPNGRRYGGELGLSLRLGN